MQFTVTVTVPTCPTGTLSPLVSMATLLDAQADALVIEGFGAAASAAAWAEAAVRWMDASRAASSAAASISHRR